MKPDSQIPWMASAAFNGCVVKDGRTFHLVYRAVSAPGEFDGVYMERSTIGYAESADGVHFHGHRQLIAPQEEWERYGCEDPRVTEIDGSFYIFYTALGTYPFSAEGIKVAVAVTKDFKTIEERRLVTPFNAKAMVLFPEKIHGKYAVLFTMHTDMPPARICVALAGRIEDLWSHSFWRRWSDSLNEHILYLQRSEKDHVEVGAPPVLTRNGWLIIYSYIQNYFSPPPVFGIEAVLVHRRNPLRILGRSHTPLMTPEFEYEKYGKVPNIVFPTGALVHRGQLRVYYGAADTTCCVATAPVVSIAQIVRGTKKPEADLHRFSGNPIIVPEPLHAWEAKAAFNPAAIYLGGKVHIVYRASSEDNTSVFGYASSKDGFSVDERLSDPIYAPRADFEAKKVPNGNSGCEDPRITKIGNTLYMCYTAFNGVEPPRVALTSISVDDFLAHRWNWTDPQLISPPGVDDKDAALFPKKIGGKFVILHRLGVSIWIDFVDRLTFGESKWLKGKILMNPRTGIADSSKIGIAGPPIATRRGWLLLYHGVARKDHDYRVKAVLLDLKDPTRVLARTQAPILAPEMSYEIEGQVNNVVFPCGSVVIRGRLFVYYGTADSRIGVATMRLRSLLDRLEREKVK
ncbi:MAG: hypothetical protein AAB490_05185 [Patescibacteria group bacterium]